MKEQWVDKRFVIDPYSKESILKKFDIPQEKVEVSFFPLDPKHFKDKDKINGKNIILMLSYAIDEDYIWGLIENLINIDNLNLAIVR